MFNSSLIELLKTLTAKEIKEFKSYVSSPFFNKNENVTNLFLYIQKYHPAYTHRNLAKETVFAEVFGSNKLNKGLMATTIFHLSKQLEGWMSYTNFSQNRYKQNEFLLKELENRNLTGFFEKVHNRMNEETESRKIDSEVLSDKLWLNAFYSNFISTRTMAGGKGLDKAYEEMGEDSTIYFLLWARNIIQNFRSREQFFRLKTDFNILKSMFDSIDLEGFLKRIKNQPGNNAHVIEFVTYQILCILDTKNEHYYYKCKQKLETVMPFLGENERFTAINNLLFSAQGKMNLNFEKYSSEYFRLLKSMVETNAYKGYGPHITITFYDAVVNTALNHNETEWTEYFVNKYNKELPKDTQKNMLNYSYARIEAEKGNFEVALGYYNRINVDSFLLKIRLRTFLIKLYYDTGQYETVLSHSDSFRHFLSGRENISVNGRLLYSRFLKILNMLVNYQIKRKPVQLEKIKHSLETNENVVNKLWLIEKLNSIIVKEKQERKR